MVWAESPEATKQKIKESAKDMVEAQKIADADRQKFNMDPENEVPITYKEYEKNVQEKLTDSMKNGGVCAVYYLPRSQAAFNAGYPKTNLPEPNALSFSAELIRKGERDSEIGYLKVHVLYVRDAGLKDAIPGRVAEPLQKLRRV
ncbi:MAG: hypothetical protein M1569_00810 [Candidatus Marsarchaeota archaeon]|nr:hypothetical protein [Candidatus Marsarchaeota archaeon]